MRCAGIGSIFLAIAGCCGVWTKVRKTAADEPQKVCICVLASLDVPDLVINSVHHIFRKPPFIYSPKANFRKTQT
jgi:hypothetical protein